MLSTRYKTHFTTFTITSLLLLSTACSNSGQFPSPTNSSSSNTSSSTSSPDNTPSGSTPAGAPPAPQPVLYQMTALSWESSTKPERQQWSAYLEDIILNKWSSLLAGADDMDTFCPKYQSLDNNQRANVWAALFSGVAKYESAYSPTSRYQETTMGTDPITQQPVWSEGLLQLSYQDIQGFPFCDFDWSKDKSLNPTDPNKTILDPYKNLYCGVGIMAKQITRKGLITVSSGAYWSTLKSGGRYQQIAGISAIVKKIPFCN